MVPVVDPVPVLLLERVCVDDDVAAAVAVVVAVRVTDSVLLAVTVREGVTSAVVEAVKDMVLVKDGVTVLDVVCSAETDCVAEAVRVLDAVGVSVMLLLRVCEAVLVAVTVTVCVGVDVLDDDAVAAPGCIEAYRQYFLSHPDVQAGGGPIDPDWGTLQRPSYWRPEFEVNRAGLRYPDTTEFFPEGQLPFGANMFMRADAFRTLGGFDRALGMNGKKLGLAEETEWFLRLQRTGARIGYVANAPVSHWVNPRDITRSGLLHRAFQAGIISVEVFHVARPECGWIGWCRHALSAAVRFRLHMGEQVYLMLELGRLWAWSRKSQSRRSPADP